MPKAKKKLADLERVLDVEHLAVVTVDVESLTGGYDRWISRPTYLVHPTRLHELVLAPCPAHPRHYGIYFSIGDQPRGFTPIYAGVVFGKTVPYRPVIGYASRMARAFARQQKCRWVYRPDRPKPFRKVEL